MLALLTERKLRVFYRIWIGQLVSMLGSGLSNFAVGVWIYQQTHSTSLFAMIALTATIPGMILTPYAGAIADRFDRRIIMMLADFGSALATLGMLILIFTHHLAIWKLFPLVAFGATCGAFQAPAYDASISLIVPKKYFVKIGGLMTFGPSLVNISAPALAGVLIGLIGLGGIFIIDFITFGFALLMLLMTRIPRPEPVAGDARSTRFIASFLEGWRYIRQRPGLLSLLGYAMLVSFVLSNMSVLLTPMVLSFASPAVAGTVISVGGSGMLIGAALVTMIGGPRRHIDGVLIAGACMGLSCFLLGLRPNAYLAAAGMFFLLFCFPLFRSNGQAIWRTKVPPGLQGRAFSVRLILTEIMSPIAYLAAGPLVDRALNPLLIEGGRLADTVGRVMGVGPGRGNGMVLSCLGLVFLIASVLGWLYPRLRNIETELVDQIEDAAPDEEPPEALQPSPPPARKPAPSPADTPLQSGELVPAPVIANVSEESGSR
jgi:MFS family permease